MWYLCFYIFVHQQNPPVRESNVNLHFLEDYIAKINHIST